MAAAESLKSLTPNIWGQAMPTMRDGALTLRASHLLTIGADADPCSCM